jgi:glyoxylase-like metal-dependent hydrolase (beta-lactamase superfamily II)
VLAGRRVSHILVSHTHRDHSPLARKLKNETGATVLAEGPHRAARPSWAGRAFSLDGSADTEFRADARLADGDVVAGNGWALRAVLTPGHAVNHACFALEEQRILFSGDHVMGWSTTVVALPDGNMGDYMRSLEKLIARDDRLLLPGHGGPVKEPQAFLRGLKAHRRQRERSILERLKSGDRTVPAIVACLYPTIGPELRQAAAAMVLAHLDGLVERGLAKVAGPPGLAALFEAN